MVIEDRPADRPEGELPECDFPLCSETTSARVVGNLRDAPTNLLTSPGGGEGVKVFF